MKHLNQPLFRRFARQLFREVHRELTYRHLKRCYQESIVAMLNRPFPLWTILKKRTPR